MVVWRFRTRQSEVMIGDSLVDWRFYGLDMLPVDNTRGSNFGFSGRLLMILATERRRPCLVKKVVGIWNASE